MGALTGVCNVNPPGQTFETNPVYVPNIPPVTTDPASIAAAVNAIRQAILTMTGGAGSNNTTNNTGQPGPGPGPGNPGVSFPPPPGKNNFTVITQIVTPVKIYDPSDPTNQTYVTVNQVTGLTLNDPVTKQNWTWQAPSNLSTGN